MSEQCNRDLLRGITVQIGNYYYTEGSDGGPCVSRKIIM